MRAEILTFCDAATEAGGKLNILGAFDLFFGKTLPIVIPQCAIASRLRMDQSEIGVHNIRFDIVNNLSGVVARTVGGPVKLESPNRRYTSFTANLIVQMINFSLDAEGEYTVTMVVDDQALAGQPILVELRS